MLVHMKIHILPCSRRKSNRDGGFIGIHRRVNAAVHHRHNVLRDDIHRIASRCQILSDKTMFQYVVRYPRTHFVGCIWFQGKIDYQIKVYQTKALNGLLDGLDYQIFLKGCVRPVPANKTCWVGDGNNTKPLHLRRTQLTEKDVPFRVRKKVPLRVSNGNNILSFLDTFIIKIKMFIEVSTSHNARKVECSGKPKHFILKEVRHHIYPAKPPPKRDSDIVRQSFLLRGFIQVIQESVRFIFRKVKVE